MPTEILVPEIPGQTSVGGRKNNSSQESDQGLDEESDLISQTQNIEDFLKNSGNNALRWRRKLLQKRGTVDSLSYSHWLIFNKTTDRSITSDSPRYVFNTTILQNIIMIIIAELAVMWKYYLKVHLDLIKLEMRTRLC